MMETPGFSVWIVLLLVALLLVILWAGIFFFFALAAWFVARSRPASDNPRHRDRDDWD